MHSVLTRANSMAAYTFSVLGGLTFLCFLSTVFLDYRTVVNLNTRQVVVKSIPDYSASREKNDLGFVTFDMKTESELDDHINVSLHKMLMSILNHTEHLSPIFNWNVKQLFLYVTAEYQTPSNEFNQVVLWDKVILRGENAVIDLKNIHTKYYFWDDGNGLKGHKNVTLTLSWNIIPNAGLLPNVGAIGTHSFTFPAEYTTSRV